MKDLVIQPKLLSFLFDKSSLPTSIQNLLITDLCSDSRKVEPSNLFIAQKGFHVDATQFIDDAIKKGAAAILVSEEFQASFLEFRNQTPIFAVPNLAELIGELASKFYDYPSQQMNVIGVTGTNGKTSTTYYVAQILEKLNVKTAVIGTTGNGFLPELEEANFTTPDPIQLQRLMLSLLQRKAKAVVMEVSSHGLAQHRVAGIRFKGAAFTNLTRDHLDFHGTMENYGQAKQRLFKDFNIEFAVVNQDDLFGQKIFAELDPAIKKMSYGVTEKTSHIHVEEIQYHAQGMAAKLVTPNGTGTLHVRLMGSFNLSNILAAIGIVLQMGFELQQILPIIPELKSVSGRMETFGGGDKPLIIIDYAHTPDALAQALNAIRSHCKNNIWCVFGCGGDRDPGKRPLMGKIASTMADYVVVTDDNPRHELSSNIVNDILSGISKTEAITVEPNRKQAIAYAIQKAKPGDVVLIAGKGHENYQQIGDHRIPFSDQLEVQQQLENYL